MSFAPKIPFSGFYPIDVQMYMTMHTEEYLLDPIFCSNIILIQMYKNYRRVKPGKICNTLLSVLALERRISTADKKGSYHFLFSIFHCLNIL